MILSNIRAYSTWTLGTISTLVFCAIPSAFSTPVSSTELERAITDRRTKIAEFSQIANEANRRGLRVFLAGGLAASYGDFVKHQLLAEQGNEKIQPARLADVISNVVFPEQDYDLVITRKDGDHESVHELRDFKTWLDRAMPRTVDHISKWDVMGLKTSDGKHPAMEGNPDFARQNNDSLSIGMIELTSPPDGKSVIREAHHVGKANGESAFLRDLASDGITFFRSPEHYKTAKAASGDNPEILGVIRTLTKAFQFNREIPADQYRQLQEIIQAFDPASLLEGGYSKNWIQHRAKRLLSHAYDPEAAFRILHQLGLYSKLGLIGGRAGDADSLVVWLMKEPLSLTSVSSSGSSVGKTAGELGIREVAHRTTEVGHRLISWRYDGLPRAFISRDQYLGEAASYGNGFYTMTGDSSNWQLAPDVVANLTFDVDPNAVEGRDFTRFRDDLGVRWLNGSKLKVRQEIREYSPAVCIKNRLKAAVIQGSLPLSRRELGIAAGALLGTALFDDNIGRFFGWTTAPKTEATAENPCLKSFQTRGFKNGELFCQSHPTQNQLDALKSTHQAECIENELARGARLTDQLIRKCE